MLQVVLAVPSPRAHLVWRTGMGSEMHRNGSKVLLCFRQCGHVREDLHAWAGQWHSSEYPCGAQGRIPGGWVATRHSHIPQRTHGTRHSQQLLTVSPAAQPCRDVAWYCVTHSNAGCSSAPLPTPQGRILPTAHLYCAWKWLCTKLSPLAPLCSTLRCGDTEQMG